MRIGTIDATNVDRVSLFQSHCHTDLVRSVKREKTVRQLVNLHTKDIKWIQVVGLAQFRSEVGERDTSKKQFLLQADMWKLLVTWDSSCFLVENDNYPTGRANDNENSFLSYL